MDLDDAESIDRKDVALSRDGRWRCHFLAFGKASAKTQVPAATL